jgi:hypothetical protein
MAKGAKRDFADVFQAWRNRHKDDGMLQQWEKEKGITWKKAKRRIIKEMGLKASEVKTSM